MAQSIYLIDLNKYSLGGKLFKYKGVLNIVKMYITNSHNNI